MSVTITTDIMCDICNDWNPELTVTGSQILLSEVRKRAKKHGWLRKRLNGRIIDICPKCVNGVKNGKF